jgi:CHASE2 domain-containing sensor protein
MGKLVVLKFAEGSFDQGFAVTLQISEERQLPSIEITGKLPPSPELPLDYNHWQSKYRHLGNIYRLYAKDTQRTNFSTTSDCKDAADTLRKRINYWLQAEEFRSLRETWLERLLPTEEIRLIIQTDDRHLQRLPWHLWDLLERYPKAEIAWSPINYINTHKPPRHPNPLINILAIVGNSEGIDTKADQNLLQQYPEANVQFVVEPQRQELTDHLWGRKWDILFFAGHSSSLDQDTGRIYLNPIDSLTIKELKYALRKAIDSGLQLAIFNSCDGLGLAKELADLEIPQIIVMREPVPDEVAQKFLKYFLQSFASGESLYQSVRQARERLQGLEDKFPCATWLPVICQNPVQIPLTWHELKSVQPEVKLPVTKRPEYNLKLAGLSSLAMTVLVCGVRFLGLLQGAEFKAYDQMMRSRPDEGQDPRILLITVDQDDWSYQKRSGEILRGISISDQHLNKLLAKLEKNKPIAIGLDIYRDFPAEDAELKARLANTENLVGVCKGSDKDNDKGTEPPPEIKNNNNLGFSDFVDDSDQVMRRQLLFMTQEAGSPCPAEYSLSTQLALRYFHSKGIEFKFTPQKYLQIGQTVFTGLDSRLGGYQIQDKGQILLNYRATKQIAEQVSLTQFLSSNSNQNLQDRIVLIGVTFPKKTLKDQWSTPYGSLVDNPMPGVIIHAHQISQMLSAVLDGRPLLRLWSPVVEVVWIWGWSVVGAIVVWRLHSLRHLALAVGVSFGALYLLCFGLLIKGVWVPFVPSALSLVTTVGFVSMYNTRSQAKVKLKLLIADT